MSYTVVVAISFAVWLAGVIAMVRFRKIDPVYYPFLLFLWIGSINEVVSYWLVQSIHSNAINNNIFFLLESLFLTVQFYRWGLFRQKKLLYYTLLFLFLLFWLADRLWWSGPGMYLSYFIIFHSFVITLMSVAMINVLIVHARKSLLKNASFLICMGAICFFTISILVEASYLYGSMWSTTFKTAIVRIMAYINLFSNLLYALAVLWMPKRHESIPTY